MITNFDMTPRWTTKEGVSLTPEQMGDRHLENAIRFAMRNARHMIQQEANAAWRFAMTTGGEMAEYYATQDADRLDELWMDGTDREVMRWLFTYPIMRAMIRERRDRRRRRGWKNL